MKIPPMMTRLVAIGTVAQAKDALNEQIPRVLGDEDNMHGRRVSKLLFSVIGFGTREKLVLPQIPCCSRGSLCWLRGTW
jgi:hypothetical protein